MVLDIVAFKLLCVHLESFMTLKFNLAYVGLVSYV